MSRQIPHPTSQVVTGRARAGFTLIELILALALTSLIFVAIGMALDLHLKALDRRRDQIEQAQLARAVMRLIANDLRAAVQYEPIDFSSVGGRGGGGGGDAGGEAGAGAGEAGAGAGEAGAGAGEEELFTAEESETEVVDIETALPMGKLGLYGNEFQLQVDVSRLPRVEQFSRLMNPEDVLAQYKLPSDVKSVAYYVRTEDGGLAVQSAAGVDSLATDQLQGGLIRRELDRAVTQYASFSGDVEAVNLAGEVVAPEVVGIQFQYFDGLEWWPEWDSELMEGLPMAVEVQVLIESDTSGNISMMNQGVSAPTVTQSLYRIVVNLPLAKLQSSQSSSGLESVGL